MTRYSLPTPPKIVSSTFRLERVQAFNPLRGGHHQAVDLGEPVWSVDLTTTPLSREQGGAWKALLNRLRGVLNTLLIHDASRPRPLAYHDAADLTGWDWSSTADKFDATTATATATAAALDGYAWGDPRITAYDRTASTIQIEGLISGATLTAGDYVAWDDGAARRFVQIVEDVTASASGVATVTVEPAPPSSEVNLPAAALLEKPAAEMVVVKHDAPYSAPVTHVVSLSAVQVLRRI